MVKIKDFFKKHKDLALFMVGIILVIGSIFWAYYIGHIQGAKQPYTINVSGVIDPQKNNAVDFTRFWEAWSIVKQKYVSEEKTDDNEKLLYGAISGLVQSMGDPNTSFFPPKEATKFNEDISGEFGGIGAEIGLDKNSQLVVIAPMKNTPAEKVGLKSLDKILKIDSVTTYGLSTDEAVKKIRGVKGTKVTLTIYREGWESEKDFEVIRDIITVPTIETKQLSFEGKEDENGKISYIRLYNFYEKAPSLFYQAALKAIMNESEGVILDLRDNPGGYLEAAVQIAGWFVEEGKVVVTEEFRDKTQNEVYKSHGPAVFKDIPVIVLVNGGSASASEILAGALKENNGAIIAGQKSFGKGTVQELIPMKDKSMIKLTIAHWLTPNGNLIDKNGITPDVLLKEPTNEEYEKNKEEAINKWVIEAVGLFLGKISVN